MHFEKLTEQHSLSHFNCGETKINDFLKNLALLWQQQNYTSCKVLVDNQYVIGFYTLSPSSIKKKYFQNLDEPKPMDIPVILLGMMGVHKTEKGKGLGSDLLVDAMKWTYKLYSESGIRFQALCVDALNENSANFFESQGFKRITNTHKLVLSIQDIESQLSIYGLI